MHFNIRTSLTASSILLAAGSATAKSIEVLAARSAMTLVGCYSSSEGLTNQTSYTFQSSGWCYDRCTGYNAAVFALTAGSDCLCGDELPPSSAKVAKGKCSTACDGWPQDMCGGDGFYSLYTTGLESSVSEVSASASSGSSTNESTASKTDASVASASTDSGGQTVVVTAASSQKTTDEASQVKSSHNTAAIAAGVVVGVVGVAALIGAAFFFYRSKKQKAEGGFRGTTGGYGRDSQPPSMSDSRVDGDYMAQRRQSNGSIDDDHDFSRRILQVTNPDRR
ncbi:putative WSC domain protein [Penicillium brasilianum]|uniref:Putative WSC domain protein n=1 Tax=Penicillium brasilianum TaxID=104259 RepID=A0A1S9RZE9_PENBI|nr:putative WSC domain protein [Penicillium brasilianum]